MAEMKPTKVEWWPLPRPGELVPDYPPQDITHCFSSVQLDDRSPAVEWAEEQLGVRLDPFQREVVDRLVHTRVVDVDELLEPIECAQCAAERAASALRAQKRLRMHILYSRRRLARRRRRRR